MANLQPRTSNLHNSFGSASARVATVGNGSMKVLTVFNTAIIDRFIMIFDRATLPPLGTVPTLCFPVYAKNGYTELTDTVLGKEGQPFDNGLTWGMSTTPNSYTAADATDAIITIRWV